MEGGGGKGGVGVDVSIAVIGVVFFAFRRMTSRWKRSLASGFEERRGFRDEDAVVVFIVVVVMIEENVGVVELMVKRIWTTQHFREEMIRIFSTVLTRNGFTSANGRKFRCHFHAVQNVTSFM